MGGTRAPDAAPSAWLAVSDAWEGPVGKPAADAWFKALEEEVDAWLRRQRRAIDYTPIVDNSAHRLVEEQGSKPDFHEGLSD